jgi:uncharacterized oligopeptide transporter (OPT) family protein
MITGLLWVVAVIECFAALVMFSPAQSAKNAENADFDLAGYTRYLWFSTAVLAVATAVLAIATIGLWKYAAEQASDMKEAITAAKDSAGAAQKSNEVAEKALVAANRRRNSSAMSLVTSLDQPSEVLKATMRTG